MKISAAVVRQRSGPFQIETLSLCDPRPDEIVVRVVASGMCQTDLHGRDGYYSNPYPSVFGHEGSGVVHSIGSSVTTFVPGDHVVMTYPWCGKCPNCDGGLHTYCVHAFDLKMNGTRADGSTLLRRENEPIFGSYFQQSSFGTYAITQERYAVKVRKDAPLELLGPLACSGQTGAGTVFNVIKPNPGDSIAIFGVGAVGLAALMAAKIAGCDPIIAIDVFEERLKLAKDLGATHTMNPKEFQQIVPEIRRITGAGARFTLETSAVPAVFRQAIDSLMPAGTCVLLGSARGGTEVSFDMKFLQEGRVVRGVMQGDSDARNFIPKLVDYVVDGKFPIEKLVTFYDLSDVNRAAKESSEGLVIKPVLRMPSDS
jgi:aryl-alcohol dehydrogenase